VDDTTQRTRATITRHEIQHGTVLQLPAGMRVLSAAWFDGGPKLWVAADPEIPKVKCRVHMVSTGHELPADRVEFVSTIIREQQVWHVFVETV
jgi:hypothetical protein